VFVDGVTRDVYRDEEGQYVLDGRATVRGVWVLDADEPAIVYTPPSGKSGG
jgi:hypothetical protein